MVRAETVRAVTVGADTAGATRSELDGAGPASRPERYELPLRVQLRNGRAGLPWLPSWPSSAMSPWSFSGRSCRCTMSRSTCRACGQWSGTCRPRSASRVGGDWYITAELPDRAGAGGHRRRGRARAVRGGRNGPAARRAGRPGHYRRAAGAAGRLAERPGLARRTRAHRVGGRRLLRPGQPACSPGPRRAIRRRCWSAAGSARTLPQPDGILLGAGRLPYAAATVQLQPGDLLLLYSDGLRRAAVTGSIDEGLAVLLTAAARPTRPRAGHQRRAGGAGQHRPGRRHLPGRAAGASARARARCRASLG